MSFAPRRKTVTTWVGGVPVGSAMPVVVQSMTNTDTADAAATAEQVVALHPGRRPEAPVSELIQLASTSAAARTYLNEVLQAWARLIISCACVVDPGRVLLSGAAAQLDDAALQYIQDLVSARVPAPTEVRRAVLGDQAALHGAISYALSAAVRLPGPSLTTSHR